MTLPAEYVHQRYADPDAKVRDIGRAVAERLFATYPAKMLPLALDSEAVREGIGRAVLNDLEAAGYSVTFTGRRGGHL